MDCSESQRATLDRLEDALITNIPSKMEDKKILQALNDYERFRVWLDFIRCQYGGVLCLDRRAPAGGLQRWQSGVYIV